MRIFCALFLFCLFSIQANAIDRYLYDPINNDSLYYSYNTQDRTLENLSAYSAIYTSLFTLEDSILELKRKKLVLPALKAEWKNESLVNAMIEKGAKYLRFLNAQGELRLRDNQILPKVLTSSIDVEPVSFKDSVLTFVQIVKCELVNFRYKYQIDNYFYWDLKTGQLLNEDQLKQEVIKNKLSEQLVKKWKFMEASLPFEKVRYDKFLGFLPRADSNLTDTFSIVIFSEIKNGLRNLNWDNTTIFWTGTGLMVSIKYLSSTLLHELSTFNLMLTPREMGEIFTPTSVYVSLNEMTNYSNQLNSFKEQYGKNNKWQVGLTSEPFDFTLLENKKINTIKKWRINKIKVDSQLIAKYFYEDGKIVKVENLYDGQLKSTYSVFWKDSIIQNLIFIENKGNRNYGRDPRKLLSMGRYISDVYNNKGNLLYNAWLEEYFNMKEYSYFDSIVGKYQYQLFQINLSPVPQNRWIRIKKHGFCYSSDHCIKIKNNVIYNLGDTYYLYNDIGQLIQTNLGRDGFELFQYDAKGRVISAKKYRNTVLNVSQEYLYHKSSIIPSTFIRNMSGSTNHFSYSVNFENE